MVKNNVEIDIKTMCIESGITQAKLASILGITPAYVNRVIRQKGTVVNRTFTRLMDQFGGLYCRRDLTGTYLAPTWIMN